MKVVVFTGAGAGKADGKPLQRDLFEEFFSRAAAPAARADLRRDVSAFFKTTFGVETSGNSVVRFPTFEESLGVIELALNREESILGVSAQHEGRLQHLKRQL